MRVNMNKIKVMISGERQKPGCKMAVWCMWKVFKVIQYNVPVVTSGYTRSVVL